MVSRPMKDSSVEWIGDIPKDWKIIKFKHVMKKEREIAHSYKNEDVISLTKSGVIIRDLENPTGKMPASFDGYQYVKEGDLLLCLFDIDVTPRCVGIVKNEGVTSPAYSRYKVKYGFDINYYNYLLTYLDDEKILLSFTRSLRNTLTDEYFGAVSTVNPPLLEQQKIADFLDEKVAHIDNILKDTKKSIEYLKAYKQSLITETVTKGLNANVEMKDTGIEWIGQIPKHWVLSKIKYRVSLRNEKDPYKIGDKYIGLEHIESNNGRIHSYDEDYNGGLTDKFKSGDVLFSKLRPYLAKGFIASFDGYCSGELLTFKEVEGDKRYFLYYILSGNFIDAINASTYGTKMPRANWDYIKELPIPGLPIYEQQIIADILDEKTSHINTLIRNKKKMVEELESYKKSLIYEYVTGKKEVQ